MQEVQQEATGPESQDSPSREDNNMKRMMGDIETLPKVKTIKGRMNYKIEECWFVWKILLLKEDISPLYILSNP